jgi:hypothetical protein
MNKGFRTYRSFVAQKRIEEMSEGNWKPVDEKALSLARIKLARLARIKLASKNRKANAAQAK